MMSGWERRQERGSALVVVAVTLIALGLGWWLKTAVQGQTRPFVQNGLTAAVPADWLVQEGAGDLILLARNPQAMNQRYQVRLLPLSPGSTADGAAALAAVARQESLNRTQLDAAYRVLEETPILVAGREGYKVNFATVDMNEGGLPVVIEGAAYYFPTAEAVLSVSFQADSQSYADAWPQFQDFLTSISYGG